MLIGLNDKFLSR